MEKNYVSLFDTEKLNSIFVNNEILYNLEELLKLIIKNSFNIERLIQNLKKRSPKLKIKKINITSSKTKNYVNTINALRILLMIDSEVSNKYKEWLIKCGMERINEIITPEIIYDRLKTILYKKGIRKKYNFIKSDLNELESKINYVELNQTILNGDINDNFYNEYIKDNQILEIIKIPRSKNTTNFL